MGLWRHDPRSTDFKSDLLPDVSLRDVLRGQMQYSSGKRSSETVSPPRKMRPSEQTDEAPGQIDKDQVDIERETPAEDNESIEQIERRDRSEPPLFED